MVLPLIPLVLIGTGVATGGAGVLNGAAGARKLKRAKQRAATAQAEYDTSLQATNLAVAKTNERVRRYGDQQAAATTVIERMVAFLRRNQQRVDEGERSVLEGLDAEQEQALTGFARLLGNPVDLMAGTAKAGLTGAAAFAGIPAAATAVGSASTGTALSSLAGAAGHNATMAFLGGGSLASGGGGMALGATALNFVTVGPTLLVTGLVLNGQGEKALTKAEEFSAHVDVALANQTTFRSVLSTIERRVDELEDVLLELGQRASAALDRLEAVDFNANEHGDDLRKAMQLTLAVRDVVTTPVLDEDGTLNGETTRIILKYRDKGEA